MTLTIGKVAAQAGVGVETVRFYQRKGLVDQPPRKASSVRLYSADTVQRIRFIKGAQEVGFTLAEIRELLDIRLSHGRTCASMKRRAIEKRQEVDEKITGLRRMRKALTGLIEACDENQPIEQCAILASFER